MRRLSLRTRTLIVATLVALVIAGGTSLATYAIVVNAMRVSSSENAERMARTAERAIQASLVVTREASEVEGYTGSAAIADAQKRVLDSMPVTLARAGITDVEVALYSDSLVAIWSTSPAALLPGEQAARSAAKAQATIVRQETEVTSWIGGLVSASHLPDTVVHIPTLLADGSTGILDVLYVPRAEEAVLDSVRGSMFALVVVSGALMVILMQSSMAWVLGLVDDLRRGADSIDAGRLNERLPVKGDDEIAALAQSVNGLIERLERRSDAQARFVADASHELATPVAGIRGYTSILRAWGADDPRVRDEAVDAIDRESRRMARLTGDLLNLLHADQGLVLKTERFDLNALSRQQLAASASRWLEKDIEYVGPDEAPLVMVGDPDRVEDVLSILLDNASKYTPVGGNITVTTRRRREVVTLEVADTGQGIGEEDAKHVFDRFYRSEISRAAGEGGFGLGLAIAKSIVVSMGGDITVESVVGQGTTFTVTLPRGRT